MSGAIGNALGLGIGLIPSNASVADELYFGSDELYFPDPVLNLYVKEDPWPWGPAIQFSSPWWPNAGSLGGDAGTNNLLQQASWWGDPWLYAGCNGRWSFVGITRDSSGNALPFAIVRCFRTSTDELVSKVTSDANGYYIATTPYGDEHYLTVHASTSPPVGGASSDNLTPG